MIAIGVESAPTSSIHVVPVISPLPLSEYQPAAHGTPTPSRPRGRIAVTPVRTGPAPTTSGPSPEISVVTPTSTPGTSVIALNAPGVPGSGIPSARARGRPSGSWVCVVVSGGMRPPCQDDASPRSVAATSEPSVSRW